MRLLRGGRRLRGLDRGALTVAGGYAVGRDRGLERSGSNNRRGVGSDRVREVDESVGRLDNESDRGRTGYAAAPTPQVLYLRADAVAGVGNGIDLGLRPAECGAVGVRDVRRDLVPVGEGGIIDTAVRRRLSPVGIGNDLDEYARIDAADVATDNLAVIGYAAAEKEFLRKIARAEDYAVARIEEAIPERLLADDDRTVEIVLDHTFRPGGLRVGHRTDEGVHYASHIARGGRCGIVRYEVRVRGSVRSRETGFDLRSEDRGVLEVRHGVGDLSRSFCRNGKSYHILRQVVDDVCLVVDLGEENIDTVRLRNFGKFDVLETVIARRAGYARAGIRYERDSSRCVSRGCKDGNAYGRRARSLCGSRSYAETVGEDLRIEKLSHPYVVKDSVSQNVRHVGIVAVAGAVRVICTLKPSHYVMIQSNVRQTGVIYNSCVGNSGCHCCYLLLFV